MLLHVMQSLVEFLKVRQEPYLSAAIRIRTRGFLRRGSDQDYHTSCFHRSHLHSVILLKMHTMSCCISL